MILYYFMHTELQFPIDLNYSNHYLLRSVFRFLVHTNGPGYRFLILISQVMRFSCPQTTASVIPEVTSYTWIFTLYLAYHRFILKKKGLEASASI